VLLEGGGGASYLVARAKERKKRPPWRGEKKGKNSLPNRKGEGAGRKGGGENLVGDTFRALSRK